MAASRVRILFVVAAVGSLLFACAASKLSSLPEREGRCDGRPAEPQCVDYRKVKLVDIETFKPECDKVPGTTFTVDVHCDMMNMLGGCQREEQGALVTSWYYTSEKYKSVDDVKAKCAEDTKSKFVPPG